jgi:class 3 adenylate cyclase
MGEDRVVTISTLNIYKEAISTLVQHYYGRMADAAGDHALAEFASVVLYDLTSEIISAIL